MKKIFFLLFFISISSFGQVRVFGHIDYRVPVNKNKINNSGEGITLEFNVGFGEEQVFSIYGGAALQGKLWPSRFTTAFANDYTTHLNSSSYSGIDSVGIVSLKSDLYAMHSLAPPLPPYHDGYHESSFYFGICFMPANDKLPILKLYHGVTRGVGTSADYTLSPEYDAANYFIMRPLMWGANICFRKPLRWIHSNKYENVFDAMTLSFYYEENNFSRTTFTFIDGYRQSNISDKMNFSNFTSNNFTQKYKYDTRFGFKIGFLLLSKKQS